MTRTQTAASSLVAAIPSGVLAYLLVMVFLNNAERLTVMSQAIVGATLASCAVVGLMPFGIMIFLKDGPAAKKPAKGDANAAADDEEELLVESESGAIPTGDEIMPIDDELTDELTETTDFGPIEAGDETTDFAAIDDGTDDLLLEDDTEEMVDVLSDDEILIDDEDASPKKKKGKR